MKEAGPKGHKREFIILSISDTSGVYTLFSSPSLGNYWSKYVPPVLAIQIDTHAEVVSEALYVAEEGSAIT